MLQGISVLQTQHAHSGRLEWIGVRPAREMPMQILEVAELAAGSGIRGDRYKAKSDTREVTLIQQEHLDVVARILRREDIAPELLRRNLLVSGINLHALIRQRFRVGEAILEGTGPCHPCSRMEHILGKGGYSALRGHGGITARIRQSGFIRRFDVVEFFAGEAI